MIDVCGWDEPGYVFAYFDLPSFVVDAMVMVRAEQYAVVEVGGSVVPVPPPDVVGFRVRGRMTASGPCAASVSFG